MNVDWSFHFEEQFQRIIATIVQAQSYEDGIEWHERIGWPLIGAKRKSETVVGVFPSVLMSNSCWFMRLPFSNSLKRCKFSVCEYLEKV